MGARASLVVGHAAFRRRSGQRAAGGGGCLAWRSAPSHRAQLTLRGVACGDGVRTCLGQCGQREAAVQDAALRMYTGPGSAAPGRARLDVDVPGRAIQQAATSAVMRCKPGQRGRQAGRVESQTRPVGRAKIANLIEVISSTALLVEPVDKVCKDRGRRGSQAGCAMRPGRRGAAGGCWIEHAAGLLIRPNPPQVQRRASPLVFHLKPFFCVFRPRGTLPSPAHWHTTSPSSTPCLASLFSWYRARAWDGGRWCQNALFPSCGLFHSVLIFSACDQDGQWPPLKRHCCASQVPVHTAATSAQAKAAGHREPPRCPELARRAAAIAPPREPPPEGCVGR